jgi:excinuclease ABC subunit A
LNRSPELAAQPMRQIELRGVRVHNLKSVDLDIPLGKLVILSGVSGSGKSSLAFATLFAEGQRRYVESFSATARQQLERIERPDADRVAHVPPAIAIRSDHSRRLDRRSTVATIAELLDGVRLLFARLGRVICPGCHREIRAQSAMDVVRAVSAMPAGTRCQLGFSAADPTDDAPLSNWLARGFSRAIWGGETHDLSKISDRNTGSELWLVVDRIVAGKVTSERLLESAEVALREGGGRCWLMSDAGISAGHNSMLIDGRRWNVDQFSRRLECTACHREFLPLEPRLFSHVSSGACLVCRGTGVDPGDATENSVCRACNGTRFRDEARAVLLADLSIVDVYRLSPSGVVAFIRDLGEVLPPDERQRTELIRADATHRLNAVCELGLDYLTLNRGTETLSGGELRRLMLSAVIGSRMTGTLVVVDEPSAGLSQQELPLIVAALRRVRELRNSVIAVEHSPFVVAAADHVIELGPGAGPAGGNVVYQGSPRNLSELRHGERRLENPVSDNKRSTTEAAAALTDDRRRASTIRTPIPSSGRREIPSTKRLRLTNIEHHNLHDLCVDIALGELCLVTGPSGSGKTSLVVQVLYPAVCRQLGVQNSVTPTGTCELSGGEELVEVVLIDQSPLTKSSRSNPATWLNVFDEIRQTFAATVDAKLRGFTARQFSFNSSSGGCCRSCLGTGILKQDMQFLPDVTLTCSECRGTRYRADILEVKYRGRSIADVLAMSVSDAAVFFRSQPRIQYRFQLLKQIGLDYLVLGQPSESLSGGEAQRLKLAARLAMPVRGSSLIICDEPTTGLHPADVSRLIDCFRELLANGHSVVLADNSPELIAAASQVIELGAT